MRKSFAAIMALVLILGGTLPAVRLASPWTASAYAPPPPTLPASTPPPAGSDVAGQPFPTPPSPDDLPPEIEEVRARQAIEAVLEKYLRYWGPRYQADLVKVTVEGEWAYAIAQWQSEARTLEGPIHILAHRLPDGTWQALMPGTDGLYLQWVDTVPESLVPSDEKSQLRIQAVEVDALRRPQATSVILPVARDIPPSEQELSGPESFPGSPQPLAMPTPVSSPVSVPTEITMVPGTVAVEMDVESAVRQALARALDAVPAADSYSISDVQESDDWLFVSTVGLKNLGGDVDWNLDDAIWAGLVLLRQDDDGHWSGAVEGTVEFSRLLADVSVDIISATAKQDLDPLQHPLAPTSAYRFPWESSTNMQYGEFGVHDAGFFSGWKAVDFLSDGNTSAAHAPNHLLAAASGSVSYVCRDSTSVAVRIGDLLYAHLLDNSNLNIGHYFSQGDEMGQLRSGSFSDNCGWANQSANWFHVHWGFSDTGSFDAGGWTLNLSDGLWRRGSETRGIYAWFEAEDGGTCSAPSLSEPSDGATVGSRTVTFRWDPPVTCPGLDVYTFRVVDDPSKIDSGPWVIDHGIDAPGTSTVETFDRDGDFWWAVWPCRGCKSGSPDYGDRSDVWHFRIDTSPSCNPQEPVELWEHASCSGAGLLFPSEGWWNLTDYGFNDIASSIGVQPGWSAKLWLDINRQPSNCYKCLTSSDSDFSGDYFDGGCGVGLNDQASSIEVFYNSNCGAAVDDAEFVGQSQYPTVEAGQQFSIYFEVRNTGNTTWRDSDGYGLENINDQPLGAWPRQEIGDDVPPGATKRWDIQMTAPSEPGVYRTQWMLKHWDQTFGPNMFIDVTVIPVPVDDAEFVGQSQYPTVEAGQQFFIYFEVRNSGNTTWRDSDGYGLENINDQPLGAWPRQEIGGDVPPGATKRWDIQMTAPSEPGVYRTQWMLKHWDQTFGPNMFIDVTVPDVGPVVYGSHAVDDDNSGESSGNGDGVINGGETIELYVTLYNQGADTAIGVDATISTSDPYVTWLYNTDSDYPDIPGGGMGTNGNDFDFAVDPSTPDGHVIQFHLDISASNGGPWSDSFSISVVCPWPDLVPSQWGGWQYPIVPSSITGTSVVNILYAGYPTYIDWGLTNAGDANTGGSTYGDLYIDDTRIGHHDFGDVLAGQTWAFFDWVETVETPGWHTLKFVADPDNLIAESDETNNVWQRDFYWIPSAPYADDMENGANDWTATGLWHQVGASSPYPESHSGTHSWWYGQDATGNYNTGATNSGDLTSPSVYIPSTGYYLRFWYWYETETQGQDHDQRWIQISVDDGPFNDVLQLSDDPMHWWLQGPAIDLSGYAGHTIQVRFHFDAIDSDFNDYRGWYIDDFEISTTPPPSCADNHEPNDTPAEATHIAYGQTLSADTCPGGDYDFYTFSGTAGDKVVIDIDAKVNGSLLDSYVFLLDSDGASVLAEHDDEILYEVQDSKLGHHLPHDGTYYIKVRAWNHPSVGGTDYFYTIHLLTDDVNPSSAEITSPGNDAWLNTALETITVSASDDDSGINRVEFLWHDADWQNSDWVWLGADQDGRDGWSFGFDTSGLAEQQGGAFYIWAFDWVGNWTGAGVWNLGIDRTAPTATASVSPMYGDAPFRDFYVEWDGSDNLSGIASYDVQYRDGAGSNWTDLTVGTTETYIRFIGLDGHTYYFRARARDLAGNQCAYAGGDGDAQYTVDICDTTPDAYEVDDIASDAKWITTDGVPQTHNIHAEGDQDWVKFYADAGVTYTLATTNTGGHADTVLHLYDVDGATLIDSNDDYPGVWPASRLDWQPSASGTYYAMVDHWDEYAYGCTTEYGLFIITGGETSPYHIHLPLVLGNFNPSNPPASAVETLNFKVSFQGRDSAAGEPQDVPIKVTIENMPLDQVLFESDWVPVTPADGSDNWGTASVDVSSAGLVPGQSYQVFVRGAMHLAKRVTMSLTDGMTIDYTDPGLNSDGVLWTCDIDQDNQVTSTDLTIQLLHYSETPPPEPDPSSEVYRSDQNGDGAINTIDYSICALNLGKVGDSY